MSRPDQPKLDLLHCFGALSTTRIRDSVLLGDTESNSLIYPAGRHIGVRNLSTSELDFIREPQNVTHVTAIGISHDKNRRFLAVAEAMENQESPIVSVIDLKGGSFFKRMRPLGFHEMQSLEFKTVCFSADSRLVAAVGGAPDYVGVM
jgi:hypothetical protein